MSGVAASPTAEAFLRRLDAVADRLADHAEAAVDAVPGGLTDPDEKTGERWEAGQVWAHLAEFCPYWIGEIRTILGARDGGEVEPVPFGRIKTNPDRLAAIERDRGIHPHELHGQVRNGIDEVRALLRDLGDGEWTAQGVHQTLGVMALDKIVDEFLVGHLEEHADQLDALASAADTP